MKTQLLILLILIGLTPTLVAGEVIVTNSCRMTIISGGQLVVKSALDISNSAQLTVEGTLVLEDDFSVNATYSGSGKTVFAGSATQTISGTEALLAIEDMTLSGAQYQANIDMSVSGYAEFISGILTIGGGYELEFLSGATCNDATDASHIEGLVKKTGTDDFIFPIGTDGKVGRIGVYSLSGSTTLIPTYYRTTPPDWSQPSPSSPTLDNISTREFWTISPESGSVNANISIHWADATFSDIDVLDSLYCVQLSADGWTNLNTIQCIAGSIKAGPCTLTAGAKAYPYDTYITFGSTDKASDPLPVEFISFNAIPDENSVTLDWSTASEQNVDVFQLFRSEDNMSDFIALEEVPARNLLQGADYTTRDYNVEPGKTYYYLLQSVDFDGLRKDAGIRQAGFTGGETFSLECYPNPGDGLFNLEIHGLNNIIGKCTLKITNNSGKTIWQKQPESTRVDVDIRGCTSGRYEVQLFLGAQELAHQSIVIK